MRVLVLMRGIPGSGKSSWIKQFGLEDYALSPDAIRLMFEAPSLLISPKNEENKDSSVFQAIAQQYDKQVWKTLFTILESRLERGNFTIIDATHISHDALRAYEVLASKYRYRIVVIDFSHIPLETAKRQNRMRGFKSVPDSVVESMHIRLQESIKNPLNTRYNILRSDTISPLVLYNEQNNVTTYLQQLDAMSSSSKNVSFNPLIFAPTNLNNYKKIHHIGDIHGCFNVLLAYLLFSTTLSQNNPNIPNISDILKTLQTTNFAKEECVKLIQPNEYYIFLGDYIDRGVQNAEVIQFLLGIMDLPNVCLLEGNHERWLNKWGREDLGENEFSTFSAQDLANAALSPKDTHRLYAKLRQCAYYIYDDKLVLSTHGGLSTLPPNLLLVATHQMIYGVGEYSNTQQCAQSFTLSTPKHIYQAFGHRNKEKLPMRIYERNLVLEGGVEFGGALRVAILEHHPCRSYASQSHCTDSVLINSPFTTNNKLITNSCETQHIKQNSFIGVIWRNDKFTEIYVQNRSNLMQQNERHQARSIFKLLDKLRSNKYIKEREFKHISSFNFTKQAFFDKHWNEIVCKARGLFINTRDMKILARSYDKFFNYQECATTTKEYLKEHLSYPIEVFAKENGFLGIISVEDDSLFVTSKSDPTSEYAGIARALIQQTLYSHANTINCTASTLEYKLCKHLKKQNLSLVVEVIHPEKDPHIIAYNKPQIILLDAIYNTLTYKKLPYNELCALGREFGLPCKQHIASLASWEELEIFLQNLKYVQAESKYQVYDDSILDTTSPTTESNAFVVHLLDSGERERGFIEGFVLEDNTGFMFKYKTPYYRFWKELRTKIEKALCTRTLPKPSKCHTSIEISNLESAFLKYIAERIDKYGFEKLERMSLVALRAQFLKEQSKANI